MKDAITMSGENCTIIKRLDALIREKVALERKLSDSRTLKANKVLIYIRLIENIDRNLKMVTSKVGYPDFVDLSCF